MDMWRATGCGGRRPSPTLTLTPTPTPTQATVKNPAVLAQIEKLIGVPADMMASSLTTNTIVARGETVSQPL
jgi:hypothetical protein